MYNMEQTKSQYRTVTIPVTLNRQARNVEFHVWDEKDLRASSGVVANARRGGGKNWGCALRAFGHVDKDGNEVWKVAGYTVRLNRQYPIVGWRDESDKQNDSQHNTGYRG